MQGVSAYVNSVGDATYYPYGSLAPIQTWNPYTPLYGDQRRAVSAPRMPFWGVLGLVALAVVIMHFDRGR